ncbi:heme peroxidase [Mycena leptocephala]|nr:heme peroxidase [Mycena leptocephala]
MLRLSLFAYFATVTAYIWPSPQLDALEALRFEQPFANFIQPCNLFSFDAQGSGSRSGRSNAADWIRTVRRGRWPRGCGIPLIWHRRTTIWRHITSQTERGAWTPLSASPKSRCDLRCITPSGWCDFGATHYFLQDAGDGFQNTMLALFAEANRYVSIADVLALAAIFAVDNCGGPEIPFRGGRVDAGEPNAPGVPQPQDDLDSHIASFSRQGFTQTEMIGLVACGHTFGGVQHAPFPDIVQELNDPNNTQSVTHFDSTSVQFDNNIATEYISGTTQNPLVVGLNDTTNSDKRIFGSDGNNTMRSFAESPELFASTCAELMARMLDTVPSGVQLTQVIIPCL